jgi:hypothetical protein
MSTMSRAEYKAAILAAAESGALKEALEYWHLHNLAVVYVRENNFSGRRTFGITFDQHWRLKGVLERLKLTSPAKFRRSEARELYTFTAGVGYDCMDADLLGGDASGQVKAAFLKAGLVID